MIFVLLVMIRENLIKINVLVKSDIMIFYLKIFVENALQTAIHVYLIKITAHRVIFLKIESIMLQRVVHVIQFFL